MQAYHRAPSVPPARLERRKRPASAEAASTSAENPSAANGIAKMTTIEMMRVGSVYQKPVSKWRIGPSIDAATTYRQAAMANGATTHARRRSAIAATTPAKISRLRAIWAG